MTTSKSLDTIREHFTLSSNTISSYEIGNATYEVGSQDKIESYNENPDEHLQIESQQSYDNKVIFTQLSYLYILFMFYN